MTITQFTVASAAPVPEPLTILGTVASLGFGVMFKKKKGATGEVNEVNDINITD